MKRARIVFVVALLTLTNGCNAPIAELPGEGLWRFVNYWAIWCGPCREEVPILNIIDQRIDVQVLGVNFDGVSAEQLADQVTQLGITFSTLSFDPAVLLGKTTPNLLPTTWLINPKGQVVATLIGPQTEVSLAQALDDAQHLAVKDAKKTPAK